MKIKLTDAEGAIVTMIVPEEEGNNLLNAHTLIFRDVHYGYNGMAGGSLMFKQRGSDFHLKEEWVR